MNPLVFCLFYSILLAFFIWGIELLVENEWLKNKLKRRGNRLGGGSLVLIKDGGGVYLKRKINEKKLKKVKK